MHTSLENYLRQVEAEGRLDSAGQFTVDLRRALEKLAGFQLPRPGDWALKLIQAAVAGGAAKSITVRLGRKQAEFSFAAPATWTVERLQADLLDPNPEPERAFAHLKVAFWNVAVNQQRPVELALPGESQALVFFGGGFELVPLEGKPAQLRVAVAHQPAGRRLGFWASLKLWRQSNSEIHKSLSARAFTCPLPLTVDGRRIDALHFDPLHGFSPSSQPLVIGRLDEGEPRWPIPAGTLENLSYRKAWTLSSRLRELSDEANQVVSSQPMTWVAYLISLHLHYATRGKARYLRHVRLPSQCHWVADGVVTHLENYPVENRATTLAAFLCADGLATDLTTLTLATSGERSRRYWQAARALQDRLHFEPGSAIEELLASHTAGDKVSALLFAGMGLMTIVAVPVGLFFWWAAIKTLVHAGETEQKVVEEALADLKLLHQDWSAMIDPPEEAKPATEK